MRPVFITGGTGYMGRRLVELLLKKGRRVVALVRPGSEGKLPSGAEAVVADPFDPLSFFEKIPEGAVFVQLLGVAHPSPRKATQFQTIDFQSVRASAEAAQRAGAAHFVYVSVAQAPTKVMAEYQKTRAAGEALLLETGLPCTFLRPWYVVGPGHRWPLALLPGYWLARFFPKKARERARALSLVTLPQMLAALEKAVENAPPAASPAVFEVSEIRAASQATGFLEKLFGTLF